MKIPKTMSLEHLCTLKTTIKADLLQITGPVVIDGYTQPGAISDTMAADSDAVLEIGLDGYYVGGTALYLMGGHSTVPGLVLGNFDRVIVIEQGGTNVIEGNFIGIDATGSNAFPTLRAGIAIQESSGNRIGTAPAGRNVISGGQTGIELWSGNVVQGNYLGVLAMCAGNLLTCLLRPHAHYRSRWSGASHCFMDTGQAGVRVAGNVEPLAARPANLSEWLDESYLRFGYIAGVALPPVQTVTKNSPNNLQRSTQKRKS